jgi:hypothetical protein
MAGADWKAGMAVPSPTPIYRITHVDNLPTLLKRGGLHAPLHTPNDGLPYRTIHNVDIQNQRQVCAVPCGPGGTIHDYVAFYFGYRSPMLLQLHTGRVAGYTEKQDPLVYLVSTAQAVAEAGCRFAFSDGHGIAAFTAWFDDLKSLGKVDWNVVYARYWADDIQHMDRQRRKQAEFLVHRYCDWGLIQGIGVVDTAMKSRVTDMLAQFGESAARPVVVRPQWYY